MLFCCLWRNVETSCHKHFVVLSRHQQTPPLTTSEVSQLAGWWSDGVVLITPGWYSSVNIIISFIIISLLKTHVRRTCLHSKNISTHETRYRLRIVISAYPSSIFPPVKKKCRYVYSFRQNVHERDGRTDGWTDTQTDRHRMTAKAALA